MERLLERGARLGERRARERIEAMEAEMPRGIVVEAGAEGVRLEGRGLRRRFALEPALRWLLAGLR